MAIPQCTLVVNQSPFDIRCHYYLSELRLLCHGAKDRRFFCIDRSISLKNQ